MADLLEKLWWLVDRLIRFIIWPGLSSGTGVPNSHQVIIGWIMDNPILLLFCCIPFVFMVVNTFNYLRRSI